MTRLIYVHKGILPPGRAECCLEIGDALLSLRTFRAREYASYVAPRSDSFKLTSPLNICVDFNLIEPHRVVTKIGVQHSALMSLGMLKN